MTYIPPSGFLERTDDPADQNSRISERFHTDPACPRIKLPDALVAVGQPFSAPRCSLCAAA